MSKELKPCPCCGGKAELRHRPFDEDFFIKCEYQNWKCNTQTLYYETEEEAIEAWNRRPSPWHTGEPTEEGEYLVWVNFSNGEANSMIYTWRNKCWYLNYPSFEITNDIVIAWQKIEPYEE